LDSELVIAATFCKFGVKFSASGDANPTVVSKEEFLIYALNHFFAYGRIPKATISWMSVFLDSLDKDDIIAKLKQCSNMTQIIFEAIVDQLGKKEFKGLFSPQPLAEIFCPYLDLKDRASPHFKKFNISLPRLEPEVPKYIQQSFIK
jgi:hypothetical protein